MDPQQLLSYFQGREAPILAAIREIVDIQSPSRNPAQSRAVADWVEAGMRETGAELVLERIPVDDGEHLVIRAFPGDGKHLMLLGHTDTVHPLGCDLQNPTRIDGDRFFGCGIFDMKANIVLMIEALRYFAATGERPARPVAILLSCDEEIGSHTGRPLVELLAADAEACLVFEPSLDGRVKTGRKGTGMFVVHAHGIPSHAGLDPEKGASSILELSRHIAAIHKLNDPASGTTVNVTTIKGGTTSNVIPEHASCEVDVRFTSMEAFEKVKTALDSLSTADTRVRLEILGGLNRPPLERSPEVVRLFEKAKALAAGFGYTLAETQVGGASDGNFVAARGVPVLDGLGIAGMGAHTLEEHILVSDIALRATLVTQLLISY